LLILIAIITFLGQLSEAQLMILGVKLSVEFGTHSARKGVGTYCLGQVGGPTPISVNLRMGHSLGKIRDKYIFVSEGGDQLCGRTVCGLDFTDISFATLPPHFKEEANEFLTEDFYEGIMPGYKKKPTGFRRCVPYLLASLVYHEEFLRTFLSADHPIFRSRVFTHNEPLAKLRELVVTGIGRCPYTKMTATGIPTHIVLAKEVSEIIKRVTALELMLKEKLDRLERVLPEDVATRVSEEIRQSFEVNGVVPLHKGDLLSVVGGMESTFRNEMEAFKTYWSQKMNEMKNSRGADVENGAKQGWAWRDFRLPGEMVERIVPVDFMLPKNITVFGVYDLWFNGDMSRGIRPYRYLNRRVDIQKKDNMNFCRIKGVMDTLEEIAVNSGSLTAGTHLGVNEDGVDIFITDDVNSICVLSKQEQDLLFVIIYNKFLEQYYPDGHVQRKNDLCCGTAYNKVSRMKSQLKRN